VIPRDPRTVVLSPRKAANGCCAAAGGGSGAKHPPGQVPNQSAVRLEEALRSLPGDAVLMPGSELTAWFKRVLRSQAYKRWRWLLIGRSRWTLE
jgi:hypothetical protein